MIILRMIIFVDYMIFFGVKCSVSVKKNIYAYNICDWKNQKNIEYILFQWSKQIMTYLFWLFEWFATIWIIIVAIKVFMSIYGD